MTGAIRELSQCVRDSAERATHLKTLRNCCIPVALVLRHFLELAGFHAVIVWGFFNRPRIGERPHCWIMCGDIFIDLTATQFKRSLPRVYISEGSPANYRTVRTFVPENEIVMVHANHYMLEMAENIRIEAAKRLSRRRQS